MKTMCVQFGPDQAETLDRLAASLGCTKASVLRYGLRLIATATKEARRGNRLALVAEDDRVVGRLLGVWDDAAETVGA